MKEYEIIDITPDNVEEYDLLCKKSKKKEEGYKRKLSWFMDRYKEGLRIKLLWVNERGKMTSRGFIEYIPGEFAWRAVKAKGYMLIHCLWVVGRWRKKGLGRLLIDGCVEDAKEQGMVGVAMVTSTRPWLADKGIFLKQGFEMVDTAPPSFELVVKQFKDGSYPSFPKNWNQRLKRFGDGVTAVYTVQCPYIPEAVDLVLDVAKEAGIKAEAVELKSARQVQQRAPTPYGTFSIIYNSKLVSSLYMLKEDLLKKLKET